MLVLMYTFYSLWHSSSVSDTAARIITAVGDDQVGKTTHISVYIRSQLNILEKICWSSPYLLDLEMYRWYNYFIICLVVNIDLSQ